MQKVIAEKAFRVGAQDFVASMRYRDGKAVKMRAFVWLPSGPQNVKEDLLARMTGERYNHKNEERKVLEEACRVLEQPDVAAQGARYSVKAGCGCGCSPGFILDVSRPYELFVSPVRYKEPEQLPELPFTD